MRILVTGSSGMIGTALLQALHKEGHEVLGIDITPPTEESAATFAQHDLRTPVSDDVNKKLDGKTIDLIIHLAANARVYQLVLEPDRALDNIAMTHHIFEFARKNKIPRFLLASSRETYGNGNELPVHESVASQRNTESSYSVSKISGEAYCYAYSHCYNIDARIMRYSNVYGRFDMSDRFIPKVILNLMQNKPVTIYGEGKTLDFTYLDDAVSGTATLVRKWDELPPEEREYNIAFGEQATLLEVAQKLSDILGSTSTIDVGENLTGEVMNYQADISRMKKHGWAPVTPLDEGLGHAIKYYRKAYNIPE